jgi:IclR family transcriptional regulator, acetate operon repressor
LSTEDIADKPETERREYFAPAVDLAVRMLELLSRRATQSCTLTEICTVLGANKASSLRILRTLQARSMVFYDENTKRYSLGIAAVVIGARAEESIDHLARLRPALIDAAERTEMTAVFVERVSSDRMMYVAKEERMADTHVTVSVGNRFPITDVSYGKWVIGYSSDEDAKRLLKPGLRQVTPHTVTDLAAYRRSVAQACADGVLESRDEYVPGVTAISCPVFDYRGGLLGVLVVLSLTSGLTEDDIARTRGYMRDLGRSVSGTGLPSAVWPTVDGHASLFVGSH